MGGFVFETQCDYIVKDSEVYVEEKRFVSAEVLYVSIGWKCVTLGGRETIN